MDIQGMLRKEFVHMMLSFVFFPSWLLTVFQLKGNQKSVVCFVSNSNISLKSPEVFHWTHINSFTYLHIYDLVSDFSLSLSLSLFPPPRKINSLLFDGRNKKHWGYTASSYWVLAVFSYTEFLKLKSATLRHLPFLALSPLLVSHCMYLFIQIMMG